MSASIGERQAYPHPHVNEAWLAKLREDIIDPALPIVDPHHHLWDHPGGPLSARRAAVRTLATGHNVRATVFVQCGVVYRAGRAGGAAPRRARPSSSPALRHEPNGRRQCVPAPASSACCDLPPGRRGRRRAGGAYRSAGGGRFAGIRHSAAWDASRDPGHVLTGAAGACWRDPRSASGLEAAGPIGPAFDAGCTTPQLRELTDAGARVSRTADRGGPCRRAARRRPLSPAAGTRCSPPGRDRMRTLAALPNVT